MYIGVVEIVTLTDMIKTNRISLKLRFFPENACALSADKLQNNALLILELGFQRKQSTTRESRQ